MPRVAPIAIVAGMGQDSGSIQLVVTDLDGTLWGADEQVHDLTLEALATLQRQDVSVLVATGRRRAGAMRTLERAGLTLPAVVLDGALGWDPDSDRVFHRAAFTPGQAARVLDSCDRLGLEPCAYVERPDAEVVAGPRPSTHPRHLENLEPLLARTGDLRRLVAREPVLMFAVAGGDPDPFHRVAAGLDPRDAAVAVTRDVVYGGFTLTVRPPGISKWDGVLAWCRDQGLDADRVLAIGDGQNDVELLSGAAVACAIADGCDEVLALAHHVLDPPSAGGWSAVPRLLAALSQGAGAADGRAASRR